ncbi:hypothetical protein GDO78_011024 [Eleutherodactylus coqui]|uniref:Apolipoprotein C-II n=1 Tax=Eleutherodactylus coqui TaxID=57060 RepID=A0A8J6F6R6_ELECQ|nr:hypothetical protein GDO78_011024 [Eleutherodactylus coqui]
MNKTQVLAISLILLLISTGIESYRIQKREATTYFSQARDLLHSSWDQFSGKTQELIEKARNTGVEDKVKEIYEQGTRTVSTYVNIISDQVYHWWNKK